MNDYQPGDIVKTNKWQPVARGLMLGSQDDFIKLIDIDPFFRHELPALIISVLQIEEEEESYVLFGILTTGMIGWFGSRHYDQIVEVVVR